MLDQLLALASSPTFAEESIPWKSSSSLALHVAIPQPTQKKRITPRSRVIARTHAKVGVASKTSPEPTESPPDYVSDAAPTLRKSSCPSESGTNKYDEALGLNGWFPDAPGKRRKGHYADSREVYFCTIQCIRSGGVDNAGSHGFRFIELITLMAQGFLGRISFRDQGEMSNLADDLIQEAVSKCCFALKSFDIYDARVKVRKCNNAFAYFTTVIRNKMYETLRSPLKSGSIYLEDLCTDNQVIEDLF